MGRSRAGGLKGMSMPVVASAAAAHVDPAGVYFTLKFAAILAKGKYALTAPAGTPPDPANAGSVGSTSP